MPEEVLDVSIAICDGTGVSFLHSSKSVLCYCGRRFNRRFDSIKETWRIPRHVAQKDLSLCGSDSRSDQHQDTVNTTSSQMTMLT